MNPRELARGFGWGVAATVAMSAVMLLGTASGAAPMPQPTPLALVRAVLGEGLPQPAAVVLAVASHLGYGGFWGGVLASRARVTLATGLALGGFLWLVMQVAVLPFLGWGLFGTGVTPAIAVATLVLHGIYGATLGLLGARAGQRRGP